MKPLGKSVNIFFYKEIMYAYLLSKNVSRNLLTGVDYWHVHRFYGTPYLAVEFLVQSHSFNQLSASRYSSSNKNISEVNFNATNCFIIF